MLLDDMGIPKKRRRKKLKLFVWTGFCPDYSSGLAFAIARDEQEAKALITEKRGYEPLEWGDLTIHPVSRKYADCVSGGG